MSDLTVPELAALRDKDYTPEVKARLRDDEAWAELLVPILIEKTRATLAHILVSIDRQKADYTANGTATAQWLNSINRLRRMVALRFESLPPSTPQFVSGSREARAWRSFSARLAEALVDNDTEAIDRLQTPYGGLTAREWLAAREEKAL